MISTILAWLTGTKLGLPRYVLVIMAMAALVGLYLWHISAIREAVQRDRLEQAAKALERARGADDAARGAVDDTRGAVERDNEAARGAAKGSPDPLRDGLEALR